MFVVLSCLDPYDPPVSDNLLKYVVVDGFVNSGSQTAEVKLSMAVPLSAESTTNPLYAAVIYVEGEDGSRVELSSSKSGSTTYTATSALFQNGKKFRLHFEAAGKVYESKFVELKKSPVLDSVTWRPAENGVTVYVDSHDEQGSTKYYQWVYTETWQYSAEEFSAFIWDPVHALVIQRRAGDYINTCYSTQTSSRVLITSTTQNTQDIVSDFPLAFIPKGSKKVSTLYSILVQQRALDEDAYNYWKALQRTTENVGGLFDPLPSEVTGNVFNVSNKSESVLGYFAGGEIQEKRLFIGREQLPIDLRVVDREQCDLDSVYVGNLSLYKNFPLYIVDSWGVPVTIGYRTTSAICADCRVSGGVLQRPDFWPR